MSAILESMQGREVRRLEAGQVVLQQGEKTDRLYILIQGSVEVLRDDVPVAVASEPGAVFGEMSVLLGTPHTATVRTLTPSAFHVAEDPREMLRSSPALCLHLCELLARRLDSLNRYLVDVKRQFEGHDHLGMVDEVLEALLQRQPRQRIRPRPSGVDDGQLPD